MREHQRVEKVDEKQAPRAQRAPAKDRGEERAPAKGRGGIHEALLNVQQGAGNAATSALLVQAKLMVGGAADPLEHEADRVADLALRSMAGDRPVQAQGATPVRRQATGGADPLGGLPVDAGVESQINAARGGGRPVTGQVAEAVGQTAGVDLSGVHVHHDQHSDGLARSLQARAFTTGSDIFFRKGDYDPGSSRGQHVLAHELAHVVQQGGASPAVHRSFDPDNADFSEITSVKCINAGASNKGVFELKNASGTGLVAKFTNEAISKADKFADMVMGAAKIENRGAAAMDKGDARFGQLLTQLSAVGGQPASDFINKKGTAGAQGVQLMKRVPGVDMANQLMAGGTSKTNDQASPSFKDGTSMRDEAVGHGGDLGFSVLGWMAKPTFVHNLGKLAVADVLIGNQDRFSVVVQKQKGVVTNAATFNPGNFTIWGEGMIGAFDHDTVAFSQQLFAQSTGKEDPNAWVNAIINGETFSSAVAVRPMPSLGALFTDGGQKALYENYIDKIEMYMADADKASVRAAMSEADFCKYLRLGYADGLRSISEKADSLRKAAKDMSGDSQGLLDKDTIDIKLAFLQSKAKEVSGRKGADLESAMGDNTAAEKAARATGDAKILISGHMFKLDAAYQQVPQRPGKMWPHEKLNRKRKGSGRTMNDGKGNVVASDAQEIRQEAQGAKLDPAFLAQVDANIKRFENGTDRRDQFAVFELKLLKFVQYTTAKREEFMAGYKVFENSHTWLKGDRDAVKAADLDGKATGTLNSLKGTGKQYLDQLSGGDKEQKKRLEGVLMTLDYPLVGIARKAKGMK